MLYCNSLDETSKIRTYVGSDGKLHFVNKAGADTVLNFNSGNPAGDDFTLPDMTLGAYYNSSTGTRWAQTSICIPVHNINNVSFDVSKSYYSTYYMEDDSGNEIFRYSTRNGSTQSYQYDVSGYSYIKLGNTTNGSGSANCSIKNFRGWK